MFRLLFNFQDPLSLQDWHAEPLRITDFFQQNFCPDLLITEGLRGSGNIALYDIVAQYHANGIAIGKVLSQSQRIGDAAFSLLVGII